MIAILDCQLPVSSGRFDQSADELLDPDNIGVAAEISLVSFAGRDTRYYPTISGYCRYRGFATHVDVAQYSHNSSRFD